MRQLLLATGIGLLGCGGPSPAPVRYPMWEPISPATPAVPSLAQGRAWLAESRQVWQAIRDRKPDFRPFQPPPRDNAVRYTYVRALQVAPDRVEFTALSVENGKVVYRALFEADPALLQAFPAIDAPSPVHTRWTEQGTWVGRHEAGFPAITIDALYDQCSAVLSQATDAMPHLYFHPEGMLMSCGYAPDECSDCRAASIASWSQYPLSPTMDASLQLCTEPRGLFAPMAVFSLQVWPTCRPGLNIDRATGSNTTPSLCEIDPRVCPILMRPGAGWGAQASYCQPGQPARPPVFLDYGKREPLAEWSFPFHGGGGIECGDEDARPYLRRVQVPKP